MTPWVMAHRFGHMLRNSYAWDKELEPWVRNMLFSILEDYGIRKPRMSYGMPEEGYTRQHEKALRHLCEAIGTFKSARDKKIETSYEFGYELFAQFIKDGEIKLNPLPSQLIVSHQWGKPRFAKLNPNVDDDYLRQLQNDYPYYGNTVLSEAEGKIWMF